MTPAEERCSIWQWLSIAPGNTSRPLASMSRSPAARSWPSATTMPSLTATSQRVVSAAVATVPLRITRSYWLIAVPRNRRPARVIARQCRERQPRGVRPARAAEPVSAREVDVPRVEARAVRSEIERIEGHVGMTVQRAAVRGHLAGKVARVGRQLVDGRQFLALDPDRQRVSGPLLLEPVDRHPAVAADRIGEIGAVALKPLEDREVLNKTFVEMDQYRALHLAQLRNRHFQPLGGQAELGCRALEIEHRQAVLLDVLPFLLGVAL